MTWKDMKQCGSHGLKQQPGCLSCQMAVEWVCWRQFCACGAPAVGYTYSPDDSPLVFYCDEHFPKEPS